MEFWYLLISCTEHPTLTSPVINQIKNNSLMKIIE